MNKNIGIIGGGPAGLYAAILLLDSEFQVTLFDHKIPFEKACGGGITNKTFEEFSDLKLIKEFGLGINEFDLKSSEVRSSAKVKGRELLTIISRKKLGEILLNEALKRGLNFKHEKVIDIAANEVITDKSRERFDFIIGADGAHGISRRKLSKLEYDRWGGVGFYIEGLELPKVNIFFDKGKTGYLWVFPRPGHASVGYIALKGELSKSEAKMKVQNYLDKHYCGFKVDESKFYSATIPLQKNFNGKLLYGDNFALIGDAAGLADPITGEGIYYAFASAKYLADALGLGTLQFYESSLNQNIIPELQRSSDLFDKFYNGYLIKAMIKLSSRSSTLSNIVVNLITGKQTYLGLKRTIFKRSGRIFYEFVLNK